MMNFLKDWIIQYQNKFSVGGVETTIDRITGTVSQEGDTISAAYLNEIQKNCIYQVNATRVIEGVLEIFDITIDGSEEFTPFNQTFLIEFDTTNTKTDSRLRFNGNVYVIRMSDSVQTVERGLYIGSMPKLALLSLKPLEGKAIILDPVTLCQSIIKENVDILNVKIDLKAPINSPMLTGTPISTTGVYGDTSKQICTNEFATKQDLGVGQTYQNVTAERTIGNVYTNTTSKPIQVFVSVRNTATTFYAQFNIQGIGHVFGGDSDGTVNIGGAHVSGTFIVPSGAEYSLVGANISKYIWTELK